MNAHRLPDKLYDADPAVAEINRDGNVNVSHFDDRMAGAGGFIHANQNAKSVAFLGTFTSGGLQPGFDERRLQIHRAGRNRKFVDRVGHLTLHGRVAFARGQQVRYITEPAVFELAADGLLLPETAPGIDLEKDVFCHMAFAPAITADLKTMSHALFDPRLPYELPDDPGQASAGC
jgi:propionate CoA-transferase